jgi:hypothetical protein
MHLWLLGVFHVKYMIVDRKILLITSSNIQGKPNVEFVVHLEGVCIFVIVFVYCLYIVQKIVDSYHDMFQKQWSVDFVPPLPLANVPAPPKSNFPFGQEVHGPCIFHRYLTPSPPLPFLPANHYVK